MFSLEIVKVKMRELADMNYYFNGFSFPFSYIEMEADDVARLIFDQRFSTKNVLSKIRVQKQYAPIHIEQSKFVDMCNQQDVVFRWPVVRSDYQMVGIEGDMEKSSGKTAMYLLLSKDGKHFFGLETTCCYLDPY